MQSWLESGRTEATTQVEQYWNLMMEESLKGRETMCPDKICVSLALTAFSRDMNVEGAEKLVESVLARIVAGPTALELCTSK